MPGFTWIGSPAGTGGLIPERPRRGMLMFYTFVHPQQQGDRVVLFPTPEAARAVTRGNPPIFGVTLRFERKNRRVVPSRITAGLLDPCWTASAEDHADGSITARGPIPEALFLVLSENPTPS